MDEFGGKQKDTEDSILQGQRRQTRKGLSSMSEVEWCLYV